MNEAVAKAVTDTLIDLKLSNTLERLDKRLFTLTNGIVALENRRALDEDMNDGNNNDEHLPEDEMYDVDGNVDRVLTMRERLHCHLHINTTGMGGTRHFNHHEGNRNHVPNDPCDKVKFTIPSFLDIIMLRDILIGR
jgi:hypothetical protein